MSLSNRCYAEHGTPGSVDLLLDYYDRSYRRVMFPQEASSWLVEGVERLARELDRGRCLSGNSIAIPSAVANRIRAYHSGPAQNSRVADLHAVGLPGAASSLLDFGCSEGFALSALGQRYPALRLAGVDLAVKGSPPGLFRELDEAVSRSGPFDIVVAWYTLHHIAGDELPGVLRKLAGAVSAEGRILVVEDHPQFEGPASSDLDLHLRSLSEDDRRFLVVLNDYWSNIVVYGRPLSHQHEGFKNESDWLRIFSDAGLRCCASVARGFDLNRLHGVPSLAFLLSNEG